MTKTTRTLVGDEVFKFNAEGDIVGPGMIFKVADQIAPGVVAMDLALLNRLYALGIAEGKAQELPSERHLRSERDRINAAKADLADDFGIDLSDLDLDGTTG